MNINPKLLVFVALSILILAVGLSCSDNSTETPTPSEMANETPLADDNVETPTPPEVPDDTPPVDNVGEMPALPTDSTGETPSVDNVVETPVSPGLLDDTAPSGNSGQTIPGTPSDESPSADDLTGTSENVRPTDPTPPPTNPTSGAQLLKENLQIVSNTIIGFTVPITLRNQAPVDITLTAPIITTQGTIDPTKPVNFEFDLTNIENILPDNAGSLFRSVLNSVSVAEWFFEDAGTITFSVDNLSDIAENGDDIKITLIGGFNNISGSVEIDRYIVSASYEDDTAILSFEASATWEELGLERPSSSFGTFSVDENINVFATVNLQAVN